VGGLERIGSELASGMGVPPLLKAIRGYRFFPNMSSFLRIFSIFASSKEVKEFPASSHYTPHMS
jgi:hypothetical protein